MPRKAKKAKDKKAKDNEDDAARVEVRASTLPGVFSACIRRACYSRTFCLGATRWVARPLASVAN